LIRKRISSRGSAGSRGQARGLLFLIVSRRAFTESNYKRGELNEWRLKRSVLWGKESCDPGTRFDVVTRIKKDKKADSRDCSRVPARRHPVVCETGKGTSRRTQGNRLGDSFTGGQKNIGKPLVEMIKPSSGQPKGKKGRRGLVQRDQ